MKHHHVFAQHLARVFLPEITHAHLSTKWITVLPKLMNHSLAEYYSLEQSCLEVELVNKNSYFCNMNNNKKYKYNNITGMQPF